MLTALFTQSFTDITEQPVSINTTLNSTVTFTCEAIADELTFRVNGEPASHEEVIRKGFTFALIENPGGPNGTLTGRLQAIAYNSNNNTQIKCRTSNDDPATVAFSDTAFLMIQGSECLFWSIRFYLISFLRFIS